MKVLLSWINDFVKIDDIDINELVSTMTVSGFEIEEVIDLSKNLKNVVSAKILKITKHPNADSLSVCEVDIGADRHLQIVTRATNMKEGDIVPLALDGANLPNGMEIKTTVMRGEKSEGMFCGYEEVGIDNSVYENCENDGLFILKPTEPVGEEISKILNMNEIILDVSVLPNRPDCNSVIGIAREIAAMFGREFKMPNLSFKTQKIDKNIAVSVLDSENCKRYMGCVVANVKNGKSPSFVQRRLKLLGHNPHSLFVDLTNYVLIEMGQPLHTFDFSKIAGEEIIVRDANESESLIALDGKEYKLNNKNLVIADKQKPLVIAGIMGGEESGTYETTKDIFVESAVFHYANIRRSSNALGLSSDSSNRYAKGVAFSSAEYGLKRMLALISELDVGEISENIVDVYGKKPNIERIESSVKRINQRASLNLSAEEMVDILNSLQIESYAVGDKIISTVPDFREDLEQECDICEEIARIYGIDNIIMTDIIPTFNTVGKLTHEQININLLKESCVGEGFTEMVNYRYTSPANVEKLGQNPDECIKILNPVGQDYSLIRRNLIVNGLGVLAQNQKLKNENIKMFELSTVFIPKALPLTELPLEQKHLFLMSNAEDEDFFSLKASLGEIASILGVELEFKKNTNTFLHPGIMADVIMYNRVIGFIGKLHPTVAENFKIKGDVFVAEIDLTAMLSRNADSKKGGAPSKLPSVSRDLAFVVDKNFPAGKLIATIKKHFKQNVENPFIFDVYEGDRVEEGKKSVAVKFFIKQQEKTLTDKELGEIMNNIIDAEIKENNAKLR